MLSSPKCHKVGRVQLALREATYRLDIEADLAAQGSTVCAALSL